MSNAPPLPTAGGKPRLPASQRLPSIAEPFVSARARKHLDTIEKWVDEECIPADAVYAAQLGHGDGRWEGHPSILDDTKQRARELGLWNMFLPKNHYSNLAEYDTYGGAGGFTNVEYGLMAELLGRSKLASEACNCAAPDTGNMEVIARYGTAEQKQQWLRPLLAGQIRSGFLMTEPDKASSDGSNISLSIRQEGNELVLNGSKWWSSGAGDDRCKIFIVMGLSDPNSQDRYKRQSMVLVPSDAKGLIVHRMLRVYGYDDAPHGHGHITFDNVRVPLSNLLLGFGRGNEIMQGRLGPGRIHHAMRSIGSAEYALEWMIARLNDERKVPFGKPLREHGVLLEWVAKSRIEIDAARLVVLNAAIKIDNGDAKSALVEIAEAKVLVPQTACTVIDRAVQAHGAMGVCQDTPLASMWAHIRTIRIADGPDEVHLNQMGRRETRARAQECINRIQDQKERAEALMKKYGVDDKQLGGSKVQGFQTRAKL
ncbi:Acyl-CoA dehydrogenase family member 11 [Fulvia fulva]|uniref:Acyl-CoA dehydrogenase family member 11 n=1 Tax=Passalora fulva TaxID=5499 RepID=A0A9Q8PIL6_PASFU|nr:Acyl-CoA dehydrogenase family member 11 [Fulvia fulva]KAK4626867.1 Acyl-CoA dehydrogenase family member 11 [Fulvia fulva]KAK4627660.1 Acyl-CoA dehydrogenase family member 11 [Fulvia fulva]UJO23101.1 Acyl-CoA dehydrogenase family member 11 [Fulvia fulva]WPV14103.1 Acyl-CoA dehydrogenase family member 11 [Fulvia fulva]WPV28489.1 Acyl-CoA dehydrogenase family member 11 [Fulvia fulva]